MNDVCRGSVRSFRGRFTHRNMLRYYQGYRGSCIFVLFSLSVTCRMKELCMNMYELYVIFSKVQTRGRTGFTKLVHGVLIKSELFSFRLAAYSWLSLLSSSYTFSSLTYAAMQRGDPRRASNEYRNCPRFETNIVLSSRHRFHSEGRVVIFITCSQCCHVWHIRMRSVLALCGRPRSSTVLQHERIAACRLRVLQHGA